MPAALKKEIFAALLEVDTNEPPANQVGANFKQFEEIAAEQELVATYFVSTESPAQKEKPKEQGLCQLKMKVK